MFKIYNDFVSTEYSKNNIFLDTIRVPAPPAIANCTSKCKQKGVCNKEEKRECPMYKMTLEVDQRNALKRAAERAFETKVEALKVKFKIDKIQLETPADIAAALKAGQFFIDKNYINSDGTISPYHITNCIRLADPARDEPGFLAAKTALKKTLDTLKLELLVLPVVDALKAEQEFEATA
jgi:hypothetical protein